VDFGGRHSFADYMDLKILLEDLLERKVDLAEKQALRKELAGRILAEAVLVA
jgi:predicted nucleotidyltransferase